MIAWAIVGGIAVGALVTISPLMFVAAALTVVTIAAARRGLSSAEQRTVTAILVAGLLARVVVVAALAVGSAPLASAQSGGLLFGDEAYLFERSLRMRDVLLGEPVTKLDYIMAFEEYANTKYVWWLSWMQTTFGPSPYGLRALNGLMYVAAAAVMYRLARRGFGPVAAQLGLALLLVLPSLLFWSVSLLKDSVFFLLTAGAFGAAVMIGRRGAPAEQAAGVVLLLIALWGLSDLRPLAIVLTGGGLALGFVLRTLLEHRLAQIAALAILVSAAAALALSKPLSTAALDGLTLLSRQHMGHATADGHAYKTLDSRFYPDFAAALDGRPLQAGEAVRYVGRSTLAFIVVPWPWDATTISELAYIPEQLAWYAIAALSLVGVREAYRRDAVLTLLLVGYMAMMSAALALTNGNVGTLVRLRTLVTRFAVWLAAVGLIVVVRKLMPRQVST
jgi:hypothetical protein